MLRLCGRLFTGVESLCLQHDMRCVFLTTDTASVHVKVASAISGSSKIQRPISTLQKFYKSRWCEYKITYENHFINLMGAVKIPSQ